MRQRRRRFSSRARSSRPAIRSMRFPSRPVCTLASTDPSIQRFSRAKPYSYCALAVTILHGCLSIFHSTMPYWTVHLAKSIVFIGCMGAGKSSIGRCLQRRAGLARVDTDELVAARFGMSIGEIFLKHGESRFREVETEVLRGLELDRPSIVVTGGG